VKIVITGATGHIGKYMVKKFVKDHTIYAIVRPESNAENIEWLIEQGVQLIIAQLSEVEKYEQFLKNAIVIHLAAFTKIGNLSRQDRRDMLKINVIQTINFLDIAFEKAQQVIYFSTRQVFESSVNPIVEGSPLRTKPLSYYANTKTRVHAYLRGLLQFKVLPLTIITPGLVYSDQISSTGVNYIYNQLNSGKISAILSPHNKTSYTDIEALYKAVISVINNPKAFGQEYNIVNDNLSVGQLFDIFSKVSPKKVKTLNIPLKALLLMYPLLYPLIKMSGKSEMVNREVLLQFKQNIILSNEKSVEQLGMNYKSSMITIVKYLNAINSINKKLLTDKKQPLQVYKYPKILDVLH
jgi:nucleoside-diphosphate-sugar epimerase